MHARPEISGSASKEVSTLDWFCSFVKFVEQKRAKGIICGDLLQSLPEVWSFFQDCQLAADREALNKAILSASVEDQERVWEYLAQQTKFTRGALPLLQYHFASRERFPQFSNWASLTPFRSLQDRGFEDAGVYAVCVKDGDPTTLTSPAPPISQGVVFLLAVVAVKPSAKTPGAVIRALNFVPSQALNRSLDEANRAVRPWLRLRGAFLLLLYAFCGHVIFISVPRATALAFRVWRARKLLTNDLYVLIDQELSSLVDGASLSGAVLVAILLSICRTDADPDASRLRRVLSKLSTAMISVGLRNDGAEIRTVEGREAKLRAAEQHDKQHHDLKTVYFSVEGKAPPPKSDLLEVHHVRSVFGLLRNLMGVTGKWLALNTILLVVFVGGLFLYHNTTAPPHIDFIVVEGESIPARVALLDGEPIRVGEQSAITLVLSGPSKKQTEVFIRSAAVGTASRRREVLLSSLDDSHPKAELTLKPTPNNSVSFVYADSKPTAAVAVFEVRQLYNHEVIGYYSLNLQTPIPRGSQ